VQWTRTASLCSPLTPTVSCATVEWSVTHPASSSTGNVQRASTSASTPTMQSSAQSRSLRSPRRVDTRNSPHVAIHSSGAVPPRPSGAPGLARTAPYRLLPGRLVLAHLARTRSRAFGRLWRSQVQAITARVGAPGHQPCPVTGVLEMPSFKAHRLRGATPSSTSPANATGASVPRPRPRPHSGAPAASTRTANPACSGLAQLRCARH